jgi:hypothetical protein
VLEWCYVVQAVCWNGVNVVQAVLEWCYVVQAVLEWCYVVQAVLEWWYVVQVCVGMVLCSAGCVLECC